MSAFVRLGRRTHDRHGYVIPRVGALAVVLIAGLLMTGTAWSAEAAAVATDDVALTPIDPDDAMLDGTAGNDIELVVAKHRGDTGLVDEPVDWTVSGPGEASLSAKRSKTQAADDDHPAGMARTVFRADKAGAYTITATTPRISGCQGDACKDTVHTEFKINLAPAADQESSAGDGDSRGLGAEIAVGVVAAALLAGQGDHNNSPTHKTRVLQVYTGNNQSGQANTALLVPLTVQALTNSVAASGVTITWSATGGATLSGSSSVTDSAGLASISVTNVGPGPGPITVTATRSDDTSITAVFTANVVTPTLAKISGDGQSGPTNSLLAQPLVVEARLNGAVQSGLPIVWTVVSGDATLASVSNGGQTNGSGQSSATISLGPTPGPIVVTAARSDVPTIQQSFTINSVLIRSLDIDSGDGQTTDQNTPLPSPLVVHAQDNGIDANGITIQWSATGGATLSAPTSVTAGAGLASINVTDVGPGPGPITVTATRADDATATVLFSATVLTPTLSIAGGDGQSGTVGTPASAPLQVLLLDTASAPISGATVDWTVISGSATVTAGTSVTNGAGIATMTYTYGNTPGPIMIEASAVGGVTVVDFNVDALAATGATAVAGDGQSGNPGAVLPTLLTVQVNPAVAGVPVDFAVTTGNGTLSVTSTVTDALGQASTQLTLGSLPGTVTVVASTPGGVAATFTATILETRPVSTMAIVSGDQQSVDLGATSQPMVVELTSGGSPVVGVTVNWSSSSGTLGSASTVTDSNGRASTTITINSAGTTTVTASFAGDVNYQPAATSFAQNSSVASTSGLTSNEVSVGEAIDSACATLQALPGPLTVEQQDLLNQCLALTQAGSISPTAVQQAIEEVIPDVSQTQQETGQVAANAQFTNLAGRMQGLRGGAQGASFAGLTLMAPGGVLPLGTLMTAMAVDKPDKDSGSEAGFSRWGFFLSGNIGRAKADPGRLSPAFDLDVAGLTAGVDYRVNDGFVLGGALGYTNQDTTLRHSQGSVNMDGWSLSGYASWYRGADWYFDATMSYGHNQFDHRRRIKYTLPLPSGAIVVNQLAKASSDGNDWSGSVTFGRDFQHGAMNWGLYGKVLYTRQGFGSFDEHLNGTAPGVGLALHVSSHNDTSVSSVFGGKMNWTLSRSWGVLIPHTELEWQHEYRSDPESFTASFINDPNALPFTVHSDALDSNYFRFGAGLSMVLTRGRSGFFLYQHTLGRSGISQDNLSLGLRVEF